MSFESYYFIALTLLLGLLAWFIWRTVKLLKTRRLLACFRNSGYAILTLLLFSIGGLIGANFITYHRLTHETPVARLMVQQLETQRYEIDLVILPTCQQNSYELKGDEWQMDARIIKWHSWANLLGLDAKFQLDRLSGRYSDIEQQRQFLPTVYPLENKKPYDLWQLKKQYEWLPWFDAQYGQSVFLPMHNKQLYWIYMTQNGLIARTALEASEHYSMANCPVL